MTPVVAMIVHQRAVWNEPINTKNSPTKPFSPGTPIEDNITTVNAAAKIGATFWIPRN